MDTKNEAYVGVPLGEAKLGKVIPVAGTTGSSGSKTKPLRKKTQAALVVEQFDREAKQRELDVKLAGEVQTLKIENGDLLVVKLKSKSLMELAPKDQSVVIERVRSRFNQLITEMNASAHVQVFAFPPGDSIDFEIVRKDQQAVMDSMEQKDEEQAAAGSTLDAGERPTSCRFECGAPNCGGGCRS